MFTMQRHSAPYKRCPPLSSTASISGSFSEMRLFPHRHPARRRRLRVTLPARTRARAKPRETRKLGWEHGRRVYRAIIDFFGHRSRTRVTTETRGISSCPREGSRLARRANTRQRLVDHHLLSLPHGNARISANIAVGFVGSKYVTNYLLPERQADDSRYLFCLNTERCHALRFMVLVLHFERAFDGRAAARFSPVSSP